MTAFTHIRPRSAARGLKAFVVVVCLVILGLEGWRDWSEREQEIARMVARGYANKTIAAVLDISTWTVGTYLRRIFAKLGVGTRAAMVARLKPDIVPMNPTMSV